MAQEPILIADSVRGIYGPYHAAKTLQEACSKGWSTDHPDELAYAAQGQEEAMETIVDLERATFTDPKGILYTLEQYEGGDIFLVPTH